MRADRRPTTVADVARHAGVSPGTVSKALNGGGQLKTETRQRVIRAAEELGFSPNALARSLISGRTYTVGILTTDSIGRFTIPLITGAEDALGAGQMAMFLCESRGDAIREQHYLRMLLARRVDGLIITGKSSNIRPSLGHDFPIPVVYALCQSDSADDFSILHDDEQGAEMAIDHLLETGRRRIAHVSGPLSHLASQHRARGAATALARAHQSMVGGGTMHGEWSEAWGREAALRLVRNGDPFDGVFCASDEIARGMTDGLRDSGVAVPSTVGVVGVDNWLVMAETSRPPLTTIDLNLSELGRRAATWLLTAIDGGELTAGIERIPATLVKRRSTEMEIS